MPSVANRRHAAGVILGVLTLFPFFVASLTGCSDPALERHAIDGIVTIDGQPVDECTIILTPKGKGLAAAANIQGGRFSFTDKDGPTSGEFSVRVNPNEAEVEAASPTKVSQANRRFKMPKRYQSGGELAATITDEPGQSLKFELKSGSN